MNVVLWPVSERYVRDWSESFRQYAERIRHPARIFVLVMAFALPIAGTIRFHLSGGWQDPRRFMTWLYVMPMYFIGPLWIYSRLTETRSIHWRTCAVDLITSALALSRSFGPFIPASGHAVFLVYSLCTTRWKPYRIVAAILLAQSMFMKLAIWHDVVTLTIGLLVAWWLVNLHRRMLYALTS